MIVDQDENFIDSYEEIQKEKNMPNITLMENQRSLNNVQSSENNSRTKPNRSELMNYVD